MTEHEKFLHSLNQPQAYTFTDGTMEGVKFRTSELDQLSALAMHIGNLKTEEAEKIFVHALKLILQPPLKWKD